MTPFEERLRHALRREEPPPGFTGRVLGRIAPQPQGWRAVLESRLRMPVLRWVMAGALLGCFLLFGVFRYREEQILRTEGEAAKEQVLQALRITSVKLNAACRKVNEVGRKTSQAPPAEGEEGYRSKG